MDPKTKKALELSIKKWEKIAKTGNIDKLGPEDCPLCRLFWKESCTDCPVARFTDKRYCDGTPYDFFQHVQPDSLTSETVKEIKKHAQLEVDFLKSLRDNK